MTFIRSFLSVAEASTHFAAVSLGSLKDFIYANSAGKKIPATHTILLMPAILIFNDLVGFFHPLTLEGQVNSLMSVEGRRPHKRLISIDLRSKATQLFALEHCYICASPKYFKSIQKIPLVLQASLTFHKMVQICFARPGCQKKINVLAGGTERGSRVKLRNMNTYGVHLECWTFWAKAIFPQKTESIHYPAYMVCI